MAQKQSYFSEANMKSEVSELKKLLQSSEVVRNSSELKSVVQKVVGCMTQGMDVSSLFTDMIKVQVVLIMKIRIQTAASNLNRKTKNIFL